MLLLAAWKVLAANRKFVSWASISQLDLNGFFAKRDGGEGEVGSNGQVLTIHQCDQCNEAFSTVKYLKKHKRAEQKESLGSSHSMEKCLQYILPCRMNALVTCDKT